MKSQPQIYPQIDLSYSSSESILEPIVVNLPTNGIRLRFDGPDQRLRLIEIIDFSKTTFFYKNIELVRRPSSEEPIVTGPSFRHIYNRLFGPAYAGEYNPPTSGQSTGIYILSYPGLAIRFSLKHKSWSDKADFVSLLTASASPAISIAIFSGSSWPEVRNDLYTRTLSMPRSISMTNKNDVLPDEIENVIIHGGGKVELIRRTLPSFTIQLNETTPQDLVAELGPPDAIFRKNSSRLSIQAANRNGSIPNAIHATSTDTDRSSSISPNRYEEDSDQETNQSSEEEEMFYNYFHHGFDVLISHPTTPSPSFPNTQQNPSITEHKLVSTKLFLHANIPGSYSFNRHRRSRWIIPIPDQDHPSSDQNAFQNLTSEMHFTEISSILKQIWKNHYKSASEQESFERGMVLNRGWGESPESSVELLGEMDYSTELSSQQQQQNSRQSGSIIGPIMTGAGGNNGAATLSNSNTQLFGFPGMLFEVVQGDLISCVTIY